MSLSTVLITWRKVFMRLASTLWQSLMANPVLWSAIWTPTAERGLYVLRLHPTMPPIHRRIYTKIIGVCDGLCLRQRPTDFLAKANVCKLAQHANRPWDSVWLDLRKRADPWKIEIKGHRAGRTRKWFEGKSADDRERGEGKEGGKRDGPLWC